MAYASLSGIHNPSTGTVPPVSWGTQIDANMDFFSLPPSCKVERTAAQSIPNAADTVLLFTAERWDTDAMHSTVTNTGRITCVTAGKYLVGGTVEFAVNGTGVQRRVYIRRNGVGAVGQSFVVPQSSYVARVSVTTLVSLAVADYVELVVHQDSGGALNVVDVDQNSPEFWADWVAL